MENLIIVISVLAAAGVSSYSLYLNNKNEKTRYREFVKSMLAENPEEYEQSIHDEDAVLPMEEESEFIELSDLDEQVLIKKLSEEHSGKK